MFLLKKRTSFYSAFALFLALEVNVPSQSLAMEENKGTGDKKEDGPRTTAHQLHQKSLPITFGQGLKEWLLRTYPNGSGSPKLTFSITMTPLGKEAYPITMIPPELPSDPKRWSAMANALKHF